MLIAASLQRLMEELQAYQAWMKKRASRVKECFCVLDREMHKKHEEICENDKKMLLEQFEAIYAAQFEAIKAAQVSTPLRTSLPQSARFLI
jgi:hypothetical protein